MKLSIRVAGVLVLLLAGAHQSKAVIIGFENLPFEPGVTAGTGMYEANGSLSYAGVIWDSRVTVTGAQYSVSGPGNGPLFSAGATGGGNYYITNNTDATGDPSTTDGNAITLTTSMVLRGAYFGAVELYGYNIGEGATQVTIMAMSGAVVLDSLTFDLVLNTQTNGPSNTPVAMTYFDTSAFESLTGITGYVIDRTPNPYVTPTEGHTGWVADNFDFVAVPEPRETGLLALGFGLLALGGKIIRARQANAQA